MGKWRQMERLGWQAGICIQGLGRKPRTSAFFADPYSSTAHRSWWHLENTSQKGFSFPLGCLISAADLSELFPDWVTACFIQLLGELWSLQDIAEGWLWCDFGGPLLFLFRLASPVICQKDFLVLVQFSLVSSVQSNQRNQDEDI